MASKTQINKNMKRKTNTYLARAIYLAKKNNLLELAESISVPSRDQASVNIQKLNESKKDALIVPGKVLGTGEIERKVEVYALGFSESAKQKLKKAGCTFSTILEALESNKKIKGEIVK